MNRSFSQRISFCFGRAVKYFFLTALTVAVMLISRSGWSETNHVAQLKMTATEEGVRFGTLRDLPSKPLPTVFFLNGPAALGLTEPQFQEAQQALGSDVLCVTLDMPAEGELRGSREPESLSNWRRHVDRGEDVISNFTYRATAVLNYLVRQHATDPAKVAVFGTSRGGFMAFHFASVEPRIRCIVTFAPVTDMLVLKEFSGRPSDNLVRPPVAASIADRNIWIIIGNTDHRVSTTRAMDFTKSLIEAAEAGGRRPAIELHVVPADGHRVPDGSYAEAARWLLKQWNSTESPSDDHVSKKRRK